MSKYNSIPEYTKKCRLKLSKGCFGVNLGKAKNLFSHDYTGEHIPHIPTKVFGNTPPEFLEEKLPRQSFWI